MRKAIKKFWDRREKHRLKTLKFYVDNDAGYVLTHTSPAYVAKMLIKAIDSAVLECMCDGGKPEEYAQSQKTALALANRLRSIEGLPPIEGSEDTGVIHDKELLTSRDLKPCDYERAKKQAV